MAWILEYEGGVHDGCAPQELERDVAECVYSHFEGVRFGVVIAELDFCSLAFYELVGAGVADVWSAAGYQFFFFIPAILSEQFHSFQLAIEIVFNYFRWAVLLEYPHF